MTPRYLAIEGVDGAGKSTVATGLVARLSDGGHQVRFVREPGGTSLGEQIRSLLLHGEHMTAWSEALLFAAQRAQLAAEVIAPALERGEMVVSDRSYYSSLAYQGFARRLGVDRVRAVNEAGLDGVMPDRVVVLWLSPDAALARQDVVDRIGGTGAGFQGQVAAGYRELANAEPERVRLVDAAREVEEIVDEIMDLIE